MVDSVTIPARITGTTDHTYTNDDNQSTGLAGGMHTVNLVPMFADSVLIALYCEQQISLLDSKISTAYTTIDAKAATVAQSPYTNATSSSSIVSGIGSKSFTLNETGKAYSLGQTVNVANSTVATVMSGVITAYNSTTGAMTVNVNSVIGTGTFTSWVISVGAAGGGVATSLATTGSPVIINAATPPVEKQILIATSPTTATWQDPPKSTPDFILINAGII
jgi:hypothetical protein